MAEVLRTGLTTKEQVDRMYAELEKAMSPAYKQRQRIKKGWNTIINGLFYLLMLFLIIIWVNIRTVSQEGETPTLAGFSLYKVLTSSMAPTYPIDTILLGQKVSDPENIPIDTVVTFTSLSGERIVHRIIRAEKDENGALYYVTKGDNPNNVEDAERLTPERVEARIIYNISGLVQ